MGASTRAPEPRRTEPDRQSQQASEPVSEAEIDAVMLAALREAKVSQEFIDAYQKTGQIVTEENVRHLGDEELAEWGAVDGYRPQVKESRRWRR